MCNKSSLKLVLHAQCKLTPCFVYIFKLLSFFFFFLFRIAIQWHNLLTVEVGHYSVEVEEEEEEVCILGI